MYRWGEKMTISEIFLGKQRYMYLVKGLWFSLGVTALSAVIGLMIGIFVSLLRISNFQPFSFISNPRLKKLSAFNPLSFIAKAYVMIIRGTPALVQLLLMYYVVFGSMAAPKIIIAGIAFGINSGAYIAEIIRAGIQGLDKGQAEAARSLGMSYGMTMYHIIIPQAVKTILPALVSEFIVLLKETSIVGWIGAADLMRGADNIRAQTFRAFEPLFAVALIYLLLTSVFTYFMGIVERKMKVSD